MVSGDLLSIFLVFFYFGGLMFFSPWFSGSSFMATLHPTALSFPVSQGVGVARHLKWRDSAGNGNTMTTREKK